MNKLGFVSILIFFFAACKSPMDYYNLPTFNEDGNLQAVIEIPAGTNYKYEYQPAVFKFQIDEREGIKRKIDFLPYPANYGYIPSTFSDVKKGGDGDPLDVLVLSETEKTGSVLEIIPIALLKIEDSEQLDYKVIAVPKDKSKQIIGAENYKDFTKNYPALQKILELWFTNYDREEISTILGWEDDEAALLEIEKWQKP